MELKEYISLQSLLYCDDENRARFVPNLLLFSA